MSQTFDPAFGLSVVAALVLGIIGLICAITVLVQAFKHSTLDGVLCLLVPLYIVYYAVAKYRSPNRTRVLVGLIAPAVVSLGLSAVIGVGAAKKARRASLKWARIQARMVQNSAASWRIEAPGRSSQCPTIDDLLRDKWISASARRGDPWGHPYLITCSGEEVSARSFGPDGRQNTRDDILGREED